MGFMCPYLRQLNYSILHNDIAPHSLQILLKLVAYSNFDTGETGKALKLSFEVFAISRVSVFNILNSRRCNSAMSISSFYVLRCYIQCQTGQQCQSQSNFIVILILAFAIFKLQSLCNTFFNISAFDII